MSDWLDALAPDAPRIVGAYRSFEADEPIALRRAVRRAAGPGSAPDTVAELAAIAAALREVVAALPLALFAAPGGEDDWTVAEAVGHDAQARAGLVLAASRAASGRWPADAPTVVPGVPGPTAASREDLVSAIDRSQRLIERLADRVRGHETDACPLDHPLVGHLRCGEWLVFAGVHDLMHLEQVHALPSAADPATPVAPR